MQMDFHTVTARFFYFRSTDCPPQFTFFVTGEIVKGKTRTTTTEAAAANAPTGATGEQR